RRQLHEVRRVLIQPLFIDIRFDHAAPPWNRRSADMNTKCYNQKEIFYGFPATVGAMSSAHVMRRPVPHAVPSVHSGIAAT
ncbi:MAG: hypothetical protein Q4G49_14945, partial [Paracoccus sp. (in: a-proteobacteria)]|nr:hypothetical protein [Paracoccus sp. (in: a-proteobacteria)]